MNRFDTIVDVGIVAEDESAAATKRVEIVFSRPTTEQKEEIVDNRASLESLLMLFRFEVRSKRGFPHKVFATNLAVEVAKFVVKSSDVSIQ